MDNFRSHAKTQKLEQETFEKIRQLTPTKENTNFKNLISKLNSSATIDEKFVLMLISTLHKKCSSELLLALLYIIS